ncbi:uncharacterized protein LOC121998218 [Zingiber officinale]|uniref:uncharacterized protein LOC121998218 n=1 Tax=Zingiber officinale TaxID=94328 RepID=UPI001C4BD6F9|nr:uncharacterized protein LOC121998218 [Zingiber officinale]
MDGVSEELERRSQYLSSLIQRTRIMVDADQVKKEVVEATDKPVNQEKHRKKGNDEDQRLEEKKKAVRDGDRYDGNPTLGEKQKQNQPPNIKVRGADMPLALQKRAFQCAHETLASMPKLESKRLALALKKEFDTTYGPAWHCIVGTSFGSYVTHSLGGFLYFSIDKVYILLFRTAVEPVDH